MATLHIDHEITDISTWLEAFSRFAEARNSAGVRSERIWQPVDDEKYVYVTLDFDTVEAATSFQNFLQTTVWANSDLSPGLAGTPRSRVLEDVDASSD